MMKPFFLFAALLLAIDAATLSAASIPPFGEPGAPAERIQNSQEFKRLRARAKTREDYLALAAYCERSVNRYAADKTRNEGELRAYNSRQHMNNYKFRQLDETLKIYIAADEKEIARWSQLAAQYKEQAGKAAEGSPRQ